VKSLVENSVVDFADQDDLLARTDMVWTEPQYSHKDVDNCVTGMMTGGECELDSISEPRLRHLLGWSTDTDAAIWLMVPDGVNPWAFSMDRMEEPQGEPVKAQFVISVGDA
jgi:hypothetical protein